VLVGAQHHGAVVLFGKFVEQCHLSVTDELQRFGVDLHRCVRSEGQQPVWCRREHVAGGRVDLSGQCEVEPGFGFCVDVEGGCGLADERMQCRSVRRPSPTARCRRRTAPRTTARPSAGYSDSQRLAQIGSPIIRTGTLACLSANAFFSTPPGMRPGLRPPSAMSIVVMSSVRSPSAWRSSAKLRPGTAASTGSAGDLTAEAGARRRATPRQDDEHAGGGATVWLLRWFGGR
jgi:hypothetical protein